MANIAFIPARSGSKRLKDKNIRELLNLKLFLWSIRSAAQSKLIDKIIFSTNSENYKNICFKDSTEKNYKVFFDMRTEDEAGDKVKIYDYIKREDVLDRNNIKDNDTLILMLPTCPLRYQNLVDQVISESSINKQAVFTCCEYDFHVSFAFLINSSNEISTLMGNNSPLVTGNTRSQDQKKYYHPNGSLYAIPIQYLKNTKANSIYFEAKPFVMEAIYSCDIDSEQQLKVAESVASSVKKEFKYLLDD